MNLLYLFMYHLMSVLVWVWYRDIDAVGVDHVPRKRPVLLCGNHQNMVMDPLLIGITVPHRRQCHFWAMKELFTAWSGPVLRMLGAVPVDRHTKDNALLYKETFETLRQDGCMAMFPEGTSYTEPQLLQFKDGTARAALEFAKVVWEEDGKPDLAAYHSFRTALIVPVGINYERKDGWRSRVVVEYGEPIEVDQYLAEFINGDAKTTTKKLTEKLYVSLRCLTVNAPDWDTLDLIHLSQRIIVPKHVDASLTLKTKLLQNLSEAYSRSAEDPKVQQLRKDLIAYKAALQSYGLDDYHVEKHARRAMTLTYVVRCCLSSLWYVLLSGTYVVPGALLHMPVLLVAYYVRSKQIYTEQVAQDMLMVMLATVPLLYLAVASIIIYVFHTSIIATVAIILSLALAAHWQLDAWDRGKDHLHELKAYINYTVHGRSDLDRLVDMRNDIQRFILQVAQNYRHSDDDVAQFLFASISALHQRR